MTSRCDPRSLGALSWNQLGTRYPHYVRILTWLWACWLIRRQDLITIGWPTGTTRQNYNHGLRQLLTHRFIESIDEQQQVFKLGRHGARLLQEAGIAARYRTTPKPRAQPGLILASEFASALGRQIVAHTQLQDMTWVEQPFAGTTVRPDAVADIRWSATRTDLNDLQDRVLKTQYGRPLVSDEWRIRLCLEIDRVTQFSDTLQARMHNWAQALHYTALPPRTSLVVLWVTNGTWQRARTIHQAWSELTAHEAFFTTVYQLRHECEWGQMDPLGEVWMDCVGRGFAGYQCIKAAQHRSS